MILIGNLKEEWMEKIELHKRYYMRKREFIPWIKDLETKVDTLHYSRREIEEQNIRMRSKNQWLNNTKNFELELTLTCKET